METAAAPTRPVEGGSLQQMRRSSSTQALLAQPPTRLGSHASPLVQVAAPPVNVARRKRHAELEICEEDYNHASKRGREQPTVSVQVVGPTSSELEQHALQVAQGTQRLLREAYRYQANGEGAPASWLATAVAPQLSHVLWAVREAGRRPATVPAELAGAQGNPWSSTISSNGSSGDDSNTSNQDGADEADDVRSYLLEVQGMVQRSCGIALPPTSGGGAGGGGGGGGGSSRLLRPGSTLVSGRGTGQRGAPGVASPGVGFSADDVTDYLVPGLQVALEELCFVYPGLKTNGIRGDYLRIDSLGTDALDGGTAAAAATTSAAAPSHTTGAVGGNDSPAATTAAAAALAGASGNAATARTVDSTTPPAQQGHNNTSGTAQQQQQQEGGASNSRGGSQLVGLARSLTTALQRAYVARAVGMGLGPVELQAGEYVELLHRAEVLQGRPGDADIREYLSEVCCLLGSRVDGNAWLSDDEVSDYLVTSLEVCLELLVGLHPDLATRHGIKGDFYRIANAE